MSEQRKSSRGLNSPNPKRPPKVRVLRSGQRFEVWLYQGGRKRQLTGSIDVRLAWDAEKRGQDLVDQLVDQSLREADRRQTGL